MVRGHPCPMCPNSFAGLPSDGATITTARRLGAPTGSAGALAGPLSQLRLSRCPDALVIRMPQSGRKAASPVPGETGAVRGHERDAPIERHMGRE